MAFFASFTVVLFIGIVIYGVTLVAPSAAERAGRDARDNLEQQAEGARPLYDRHCAQCHGRNGEGNIGPSFDGVKERLPDPADHETVVAEGRAQMPSFEGVLSPAEITAVVTYERETLDRS